MATVMQNGNLHSSTNKKPMRDGLAKQQQPNFLKPLQEVLTLEEGDPILLETMINPSNDPSLVVEWLKDGRPLCASSRISSTFERGYAVLEFFYSHMEDSGQYVCQAKNELGIVNSNPCQITIQLESGVVTNTQLPDQMMMDHINDLEASMPTNGLNLEVYDRTIAKEPPHFTRQPVTNISASEGEPLQLQVRIEPAYDSSMVVNWIKDGQMVSTGSRFNIIKDREFCILDISHCISEDTGEYFVHAFNALGESSSTPCHVECIGTASIITASALGEDSEAYNRIIAMDNHFETEDTHEYRYEGQDVEQDHAPQFEMEPQSLYACEYGPAKMIVKISAFPCAEVTWLLNEEPIEMNSNYKIVNDGAINCLEIHRCDVVGENQIRAVARNTLGEMSSAIAVLQVVPADDFRPELKHITPENPYKKRMTLKKVEVLPELSQAMHKPKPSGEQLYRMDLNAARNVRLVKKNDIEEAERLYDTVACQLKKHEPKVAAQNGVSSQPNTQSNNVMGHSQNKFQATIILE